MDAAAANPGSPRRIVIVGGVAGGMSAATRLRRRDPDAHIIVFERGDDVSFSNCGLAYYLGGVIEERGTLVPRTPGFFRARFDIDVRVQTEVIAIDAVARRVVARQRDTGLELTEGYDELLLAPGATAMSPEVPGGELALTLRDVTDIDRILASAAALPAGAPVVVIGGGYIGLELVDNLVRRGLSVTLVQRGTHLMSSLDVEMAAPVAAHLRGLGVDVRLGVAVAEITTAAVVLESGEVLPAQLTLAAIGVTPDTRLAIAAGLTVGSAGGIAVDEYHRTSAPGVFAVGDAAEKRSAITGEPQLITLAGPANRDGRYVADTMTGMPAASPPSLGTAILDVAGLVVASFGLTEAQLRDRDRRVRVIHTHPASHVDYMPGAASMSIKLIVDADTDLILGAQIVGGDGVDKRIDVLATSTFAGVTASRLSDLELAYAPQFGSAKDPVNMLGYINRNQRDAETRAVQWHELDTLAAQGWAVLDVRTAEEYAAGSIPGAVNLPLDELRAGAGVGSPRVVVHCQVGQRGHSAVRLLRERGIDAVNLDGGYLTWLASR